MTKEIFVTEDGRQYDSSTTGFSAAGTMSEMSRQEALATLKGYVSDEETQELPHDAVQKYLISLLRLHFGRGKNN